MKEYIYELEISTEFLPNKPFIKTYETISVISKNFDDSLIKIEDKYESSFKFGISYISRKKLLAIDELWIDEIKLGKCRIHGCNNIPAKDYNYCDKHLF